VTASGGRCRAGRARVLLQDSRKGESCCCGPASSATVTAPRAVDVQSPAAPGQYRNCFPFQGARHRRNGLRTGKMSRRRDERFSNPGHQVGIVAGLWIWEKTPGWDDLSESARPQGWDGPHQQQPDADGHRDRLARSPVAVFSNGAEIHLPGESPSIRGYDPEQRHCQNETFQCVARLICVNAMGGAVGWVS